MFKESSFFSPENARPETEAIEQQEKNKLSYDADIKEITNFITQHRENVDYARLWDNKTQVLFVGERHTLMPDKDELIKSLPHFRDRGMTHLAMEMLQEHHQEVIDDYFSGEIGREKVLEILKKGWQDKGPGIPEKYMEIIDVAKLNNMRVLAIDLSTELPNYSPGGFFRKRNINWARIVKSTLEENEKARILLFCGAAHGGYYEIKDRANQILEGMGVKSKVIEFSGGEAVKKEDAYSFEKKVAIAAQETETAEERFGLHIDSSAARGADFVIHLPQTETRNE